jgi:hypothetical protein
MAYQPNQKDPIKKYVECAEVRTRNLHLVMLQLQRHHDDSMAELRASMNRIEQRLDRIEEHLSAFVDVFVYAATAQVSLSAHIQVAVEHLENSIQTSARRTEELLRENERSPAVSPLQEAAAKAARDTAQFHQAVQNLQKKRK